jgi:hypothetical protein
VLCGSDRQGRRTRRFGRFLSESSIRVASRGH